MRKLFANVSPRQTVAKNAFWLFAAQGITRLFRFGVIFIAARALGPDGYGSFSYALAASVIAFMLADWGVGLLVVREHGKREKARFLRAALAFKLALVGGFTALGVGGWFLIGDPGARGVYLVLLALMALQQVRDFFVYVLRAEELMEREFVASAVEAFGTFGLAALFFGLGGGILSLGAAYVIAMAASLATAWALARKTYRKPLVAWDSEEARWLLQNGWSLTLFGVLVLVLFSASQIVLGETRTPAEVGLYALASKVITLALLVPQIVMTALFPYLIRVVGSDRGREVALIVSGVLTVLGLAVAVGTNLFAPWMVTLAGGAGFEQAVPVLRHLIWLVVMLFPVTFLDYYLIAHGRQVADMIATGIAAVATVVLNVVLIPRWGVSGAVWATMLGQGLNTLLTVILALWVTVGNGRTQAVPVREEAPLL